MIVYSGTTRAKRGELTELIFFKAEVDMRTLNALAGRAAKNKNGKSKDGAVSVTVIGKLGEDIKMVPEN